MTVTANTISKNKQHSNWFFLPTAFSAMTGIAIGLIIANFVGLF
jgi:hypothetical protein